MPERYTKNTVSCTVWCSKCGKMTEHRVADGRRGACNVCITKLNQQHEERAAIAPAAVQESLF